LGFWWRSVSALVRVLALAWRGVLVLAQLLGFGSDTLLLGSKYLQAQQAAGKTSQQQHNKALHPTAYSFVRRSSSLRFRRRVSLSLACRARLIISLN
jgi:hypothetical protein